MFNHEPHGYDCPFCRVAEGGETAQNKRGDIVLETENTFAVISPKWWKNNPANVLVVPREHIENIYDIRDDILSEIYTVGKRIALAMKETYPCEGTSFRQHNEPAGGQSVWHFHLHVYPRWGGDDLYLNDNASRLVTEEERKPFAEKLRNYLSRRNS